jgi:transcriptional regulator with XRE-family HTH domain
VPKHIGADRKRSSASLAEAFGAELTDRRTKAGWSQQALAELLGCDVNYIGQIERAEKSPTLGILISIATAFRIRLSDILQAAEDRVPESRLKKVPPTVEG